MPSGRQAAAAPARSIAGQRSGAAGRRPTGRGTCMPSARVPAPAPTRTHTAHPHMPIEAIERAHPRPVLGHLPVGQPPRAGPSRTGAWHERRRADETGVSRCGSRCPAPRSPLPRARAGAARPAACACPRPVKTVATCKLSDCKLWCTLLPDPPLVRSAVLDCSSSIGFRSPLFAPRILHIQVGGLHAVNKQCAPSVVP
jgi:hypothetical protein